MGHTSWEAQRRVFTLRRLSLDRMLPKLLVCVIFTHEQRHTDHEADDVDAAIARRYFATGQHMNNRHSRHAEDGEYQY